MAERRAPRFIGMPDYKDKLHPVMQKNYGKWKYHEILRPGVIMRVAENGDRLYVIRAGSPRTLTVDKVRQICEVADKYSQGYLRFTTRNNIEFFATREEDIDPLIKEIQDKLGFPVGGTGHSVSNVLHTQGYLHCNLAAVDALAPVKSIMDALYEDFVNERLPHKVRIFISCCAINCGERTPDIGIFVQHNHPPTVDHATIHTCTLPTLIKVCPMAAIRPARINGKDTVEIIEEKCMYCSACHGVCPSVEIRDPKTDTLGLWIGGKNSSTRQGPSLASLVTSDIPNNPPRYPELIEAIKKILEAYRKGGKEGERLREWIERIGWKRFFDITGFKFTRYLIDDYRFARTTLEASARVRQ